MIRNSCIGLAGAALAQAAVPAAAGPPTAQALADRAEIGDLITRYYNNFGGGIESKLGEFYAPDGEMILGQNHYKGIEAIQGAYAAVPRTRRSANRSRSTS